MLAGTAGLSQHQECYRHLHHQARVQRIRPAQREYQSSVSPWCYSELTLDQLCETSKGIGITGIDLCGPKDWPTLQKHGMHSPMCNGAEINLVMV